MPIKRIKSAEVLTFCIFSVQSVLGQLLQVVFEQQLIARNPLNGFQHVMLQRQVPTHFLFLVVPRTKTATGGWNRGGCVCGDAAWWNGDLPVCSGQRSWTARTSVSRCWPGPWPGQSSSRIHRTSSWTEPVSAGCLRSEGWSPCSPCREQTAYSNTPNNGNLGLLPARFFLKIAIIVF